MNSLSHLAIAELQMGLGCFGGRGGRCCFCCLHHLSNNLVALFFAMSDFEVVVVKAGSADNGSDDAVICTGCALHLLM